jgi:hypothetical protein
MCVVCDALDSCTVGYATLWPSYGGIFFAAVDRRRCRQVIHPLPPCVPAV